MSIKIWKELLILIAVFAAIWLGFSYYSYDIDKDPFSISLENEAELGEFMTEYMLNDFDELDNDEVQSAVQTIFDRLKENMDSVTYDYQIHVVDRDDVNAFTTLNGNIYVLTGLIEKLDQPEELAVILAHEIGHAEQKHVVEKLIKTLGMEALFSIISGGDPVLISELAKLAISTSFDRLNEEDADDYALNLSFKSKINPRRLGQFFLKLKNDEENSFYSDIEFIRTHPMDNSRIKKSSDFELPDDFTEEPINIDWQKIKDLI